MKKKSCRHLWKTKEYSDFRDGKETWCEKCGKIKGTRVSK